MANQSWCVFERDGDGNLVVLALLPSEPLADLCALTYRVNVEVHLGRKPELLLVGDMPIDLTALVNEHRERRRAELGVDKPSN